MPSLLVEMPYVAVIGLIVGAIIVAIVEGGKQLFGKNAEAHG